MANGGCGSLRVTLVCGIDLGSLRTPAHVAWLVEDRLFVLDSYLPTRERPLPAPPAGAGTPACYAIDGPQGLPNRGAVARQADLAAGTPTRRLPATRQDLTSWRLYRGLIEAGIELFWAVYVGRLGGIPGLETVTGLPVVCETYPRYILRRLWPGLRIPSKRRQPLSYGEAVYQQLCSLGYRCPGLARPTPDQADAMLCALAARACVCEGGEACLLLGEAPTADLEERVLREGYIVVPARCAA
jgi:predicted nuclease with RNAse H fold